MIIIHLSTEMPMGGGERQLLYLYRGLTEKKDASLSQYIICSKNSKLEAYCQEHQHAYFSLKRRGGFSLHYVWQLKKIIKQIISTKQPNLRVSKNEPIIIHCHDGHAHTYAVLVDVLWGSFNRIPLSIVLSKKVIPPVYRKSLRTIKYHYHGIQKIICVSQAIADICTTLCAQRWSPEEVAQKVCVIHDTVDLRQYSTHQKQNIFTIGIIGSLIPVKNHGLFLAIARQLVDTLHQPLNFWIIGDGQLQSVLEEQIKTLNLSSHVKLLGFREDIPELLSQLDMLLITSHKEGFCSTILQAMAAHVPVIAHNVGGIPEIIQHQKNGLLASNLNDFVQQATVLYHDPAMVKKLTQAAFETVQAYDLPRYVEKMHSLYKEIH